MSLIDRARKSLALPSIWGHIPGSTSFLPCVGLYVAFGIYCSEQTLWASVLSALMWGRTLADRHIYSASSGPDLNWLMIGHLFNLLNQLLDIYSSRLWLLYSVLTFLGFILCITTIGVLSFNTWGVCMNIRAQNSQVIKSYYKREIQQRNSHGVIPPVWVTHIYSCFEYRSMKKILIVLVNCSMYLNLQ